jgi:3-hydroxyisobutyrate dehydrogenase-like beta-hydroxyacid dehydrogenase
MAEAKGSDARLAVAVIGTGIMGSALTHNLVAAGLSTRVWVQMGAEQLAEVIEGGPLDAPIAGAKFHQMDPHDFAAEFPLESGLKDVDLALGSPGQSDPGQKRDVG